MTKLFRISLLCTGLILLLLLLAAGPAQARSNASADTTATPRLGFYNCYSRGYPIVYQGTVQLRSGGRYAWGYLDTANRRLRSPRVGSYRVSGNRIAWSGGGLARLYGVVKTAATFEVWANSEKFASYTCYFKF